MGILVLLSALFSTIGDTIREGVENYHAIKEGLRYEDIDWGNIDYVTLDGTEIAYRIEEKEEFDIVASTFLSEMDGWPHYETNTVEYEVEDGENYCFTIRYKDGTEIYRKFHETSSFTERLLEYCNKNNGIGGSLFDTLEEIDKTVTKLERVVDAELVKAGYDSEKLNEMPSSDESVVDTYQEYIQPHKERFAVIDIETTGLNYNFNNPPGDEIISIVIIDQDENVILDTYCDTVNLKSWSEAERIHGISPKDVKGYPTFVEILPKVVEILLSYDYVIAYNIKFEKLFIQNYAYHYARDYLYKYCKVKWGEDPMQMFMNYMGSQRFLKLETAAEHFGYTYNAHNALEDTKAALHVYKALRGE